MINRVRKIYGGGVCRQCLNDILQVHLHNRECIYEKGPGFCNCCMKPDRHIVKRLRMIGWLKTLGQKPLEKTYFGATPGKPQIPGGNIPKPRLQYESQRTDTGEIKLVRTGKIPLQQAAGLADESNGIKSSEAPAADKEIVQSRIPLQQAAGPADESDGEQSSEAPAEEKETVRSRRSGRARTADTSSSAEPENKTEAGNVQENVSTEMSVPGERHRRSKRS